MKNNYLFIVVLIAFTSCKKNVDKKDQVNIKNFNIEALKYKYVNVWRFNKDGDIGL
ncbi:hypothetical protein [Pontimicrobium sp. SW4]|uniref:Uncharacterized protein n=1 Tax=Pontimicrobium sp. SW4 TaxID=3153519 RepID=A0AAU7BU20_9FLAO